MPSYLNLFCNAYHCAKAHLASYGYGVFCGQCLDGHDRCLWPFDQSDCEVLFVVH